MKTGYERELQSLKPWDEVQSTTFPERAKGYPFIITAGHGYLVVRNDDIHADIASKICEYGYKGEKAMYLEEDSEVGKFLSQI